MVIKDRFSYQLERLSKARSNLMSPHPQGEDRAFAAAFHDCSLAFHQFDADQVTEDEPRRQIDTIKRLMGAGGVSDPTGEGTWFHRGRAMGTEEKMVFSRAVDELASWFAMEFWSS